MMNRPSLASRKTALPGERLHLFGRAYAIFEAGHDGFRVDFNAFRKDL
jgi:hypothetical protein